VRTCSIGFAIATLKSSVSPVAGEPRDDREVRALERRDRERLVGRGERRVGDPVDVERGPDALMSRRRSPGESIESVSVPQPLALKNTLSSL
jgi:hypothetical protein